MGEGLTDKQVTVIASMVAGSSQADAARLAGVSAESVSRWKKAPAFVAALNAARAEAWQARSDKVRALADVAVRALEDMLLDGETGEAVRLQLIKTLLRYDREPPVGETDPAVLERDERRRREHDEWGHLLDGIEFTPDGEARVKDRG